MGLDGRGRAAGGVARREYVGAGGFEGEGGGFDGTAGRDGHVLREGIEIGSLPDGEDHGIGGDGAGLRLIKGRRNAPEASLTERQALTARPETASVPSTRTGPQPH